MTDSATTPSRRTRLGAWVVVATAIVAGDATGHFFVAYFALAALVILLRTTPADAIRLPRIRSELLLLLGSLVLARTNGSGVLTAAVGVALFVRLRLGRRSAWWAAVYLWHPLVVQGGWWNPGAIGAAAVPAVAWAGLGASWPWRAAGGVADAVWFCRNQWVIRLPRNNCAFGTIQGNEGHSSSR